MNILTFDIEDWWIYKRYNLGQPSRYIPRLDSYLDKVLDLLEERDILATFFCLGILGEEYPEVIRKIHSKGHEIGYHSYSHNFNHKASYKEIEKDTDKGLKILENIVGCKVVSYRAPAFSIDDSNKWILEILISKGINNDCSIFPAKRSFGGFPAFSMQEPVQININGVSINEFPMSFHRLLGQKMIVTGGGYFRLYPYHLIKSIVKSSKYSMAYFHIKDFDYKQKRVYKSYHKEDASIRYFKNYYGLKNNFDKFTKFISDFQFLNVANAAQKICWLESNQVNL